MSKDKDVEALDEGWGPVSRHQSLYRDSQSEADKVIRQAHPFDGLSASQLADDTEPVNLRCSVLFLRDDGILLCQRTDGSDTWVLPGGTPRIGEGTATAAQREVAEETGLSITADRVAFVLETTSRIERHHLIEIIFVGTERDKEAHPRQLETGLRPSFVALSDLKALQLRPPIAGYILGYTRYQRGRSDLNESTAAYLGNLWRMSENNA